MIVATLDNATRDGELIIVHPNRSKYLSAKNICPSLRVALEDWSGVEKKLKELDSELRSKPDQAKNLEPHLLKAVLPRTWLFADGSAFLHHVKLVRRARGAELPPNFLTTPLIYQAEAGQFLSPHQAIPQGSEEEGTDFEAEVGVILDDTPRGVSPTEALKHIRLVCLINDVSLRGLVPEELSMGFGFFISKPPKALSPLALTPDELGPHWREGRLHLPLRVNLNGKEFGRANAGAMHFHFGDIIARAATTRPLVAGTLIGSGTVANEDPSVGSSCIAERRMLEQLEKGKPETPFLKVGDEVEIFMQSPEGQDLFGLIKQKVISI
jgi:fumarylacetoacetate (FAA) hydrolase